MRSKNVIEIAGSINRCRVHTLDIGIEPQLDPQLVCVIEETDILASVQIALLSDTARGYGMDDIGDPGYGLYDLALDQHKAKASAANRV